MLSWGSPNTSRCFALAWCSRCLPHLTVQEYISAKGEQCCKNKWFCPASPGKRRPVAVPNGNGYLRVTSTDHRLLAGTWTDDSLFVANDENSAALCA